MTRSVSSPLKAAADQIEEVRGCCKDGLQAIPSADRAKFKPINMRLLKASLDIDKSVKDRYPEASRWDYAVEYAGKVYFVEVHGATEGEVQKVIEKGRWLKEWLRERAEKISDIKADAPFFWVPTSGNQILKTSPKMKLLAQEGIALTNVWRVNEN
ncbi:hypothetical protein EII14_00365 [Alloprevotella sp. OH1205_COT-284]|uniref:hypothetical protein n=1 Tax=Alloprevotella sp. OH1205_COT-284 TaxID=2491043 RepID=UPI000F5E1886|nr:hypothetical protein [Alloprevotella sp. OH1205_COT-284]RRD80799.1 hypothetical protein EII14_00365 [Alloprevotella sp. OH1205_COT-284]